MATWDRQRSLFHEALARPVAFRESFLNQACRSDDDLRREVEELLAAHECGVSLLDSPLFVINSASEMAQASAAPGIPQLIAGEILAARFQITRFLGSGGMGEVYEASDRLLGTTVALKLLPSRSEATLRRFRREVSLAQKVTHPNACRVFDLFEDGERVFLTMELLSGETLAARISRGPLPSEQVREITLQILAALAAAHRAGVVHRDLKPGNVMLIEQGGTLRAVVTDFGLATTSVTEGSAGEVTGNGTLAGTLCYMAPEQLEGESSSPLSDIYALGIIAHQMLTARLPFRGRSPLSTAFERLGSSPGTMVENAYDERWRWVIRRCLERDPNDRFPSAEAVAAALESRWTPSRRRAWIRASSAVAVLIAVLMSSTWFFRKSTEESPPAIAAEQAERWVLIARVDNQSGEPLFDDSIDFALAAELHDGRLFKVVSRQRVEDVLLLMKHPRTQVVDASTGREIALRDGGVDLLLWPSVQKLGSGYVIRAEFIEPASGQLVAAIAEPVAETREILDAVRRLASRSRSAIEPLQVPSAGSAPLPRVTTNSLRALQLYARADALIAHGPSERATAESLLREALVEDPEFASAHMHLAWAIRNQQRPSEEYLAPAATALSLAGSASDIERRFIRGSYHQMRGDLEEAVREWRMLAELDPSHHWAASNLLQLLAFVMHRYEDAVPFALALARQRPNDLRMNYYAATALWQWAQRPREAEPFIARAAEILASGNESDSEVAVYVDFFPLDEAWSRNDVDQAIRELERMASLDPPRLQPGAPPPMDFRFHMLGLWCLAFGRLDDAEAWFRRIETPPGLRERAMLSLAMAKDRDAEVTSALSAATKIPHPMSGRTYFELARRGGIEQATVELAKWRNRQEGSADLRHTLEPFVAAVEGELALARGDIAAAIELLEKSTSMLRPSGNAVYFAAMRSLARARDRRGDRLGAREALEDAYRRRSAAVPISQFEWVLVAQDLLRHYEESLDHARAARVRQELTALMKTADAEHPIRQLLAP